MRKQMQWPQGRRVAVTGAAGFLGGHVMRALAAAGAVPVGLARRAGGGLRGADLVQDPLEPVLAAIRPEAIIHCAGQTVATADAAGRERLFANNLTATTRLLDAVARTDAEVRVVVVSSAAIWAPMPPGLARIDERFEMAPIAAYGESKRAATQEALARDLDVAVAVPFNILGPGQPGHLVPQVFIDQLRDGSGRFSLRGPEVARDWLDVRDVAAALIALAEPGRARGLFNVASGDGVSLCEIVAALCRIGGWRPEIEEVISVAKSGVPRSIGDASRLRATTGWGPVIPLEQSLTEMVRISAAAG